MDTKTFYPKTYAVLTHEGFKQNFSRDLIAGIITGIIALPLAIAFGIASGATPEQGLFSAIIGGLIISLFSGSRVQIGGPTGAFIVVVYNIIATYGIAGLIIATIMAGIILILLGVLRLGSIIKFIPYPVTQGFTSGIAVLIAMTQLNDFLGLSIKNIPASVVGRIGAYWEHLGALDTRALAIGAITIFLILLCKKFLPRIPGSLIAIIILTVITSFFHIDIETIFSRFGTINSSFPHPVMPDFSFELLVKLLPSALTIAILGAIESLLSAVVADGMTGMRHNSNTELIAQGISNIVTPMFGGIPTTGAIARTATNIQNGGRTPLAGIFHAVTLLLIVEFFGQYASAIPLAILSGILLTVALNMSEYRLFFKMFRAPKSDVVIMLTTFILTILVDLTVAIPTGIVLASLLFMSRMERVAGGVIIEPESNADPRDDDPFAIGNYTIPQGVCVYEINGPFFFGAAKKFQDEALRRTPKVLILRMRNVSAIDATGLFALQDIIKTCKKNNCVVLISAIQKQPLTALKKSGITDELVSKQVFLDISSALKHAEEIIASIQSARSSRRAK